MPFEATLFKYPGPGGWTFAPVPPEHAPPVTRAWGRTPVVATVNGVRWETSVWADREHGTLLPMPKHVRKGLEAGDVVTVELSARPAD